MQRYGRRRVVLRDNIYGITNSEIKRLANEAGNPRVSMLVYEKVREETLKWLNGALKAAIVFVENRRAKTIDRRDFEVLKIQTFTDVDVKNKLRRLPINRLFREVAQDYKTNLRFTEEAVNYLKAALEGYLLTTLEQANQYRELAKRETLYVPDLEAAGKDFDNCFI